MQEAPPSVGTDEIGVPVIQGTGVWYSYEQETGRRPALSDCSFLFRSGEMTVLTGPSGAGKRTLLTLIGALRTMQTGSLCVLDREINGLSLSEQMRLRRQIGFIFQQHNLLEALTAIDNVRLAMHVNKTHTPGDLKTKPMELLAALGLGALAQKKPRQLSGGERQRVAVARALVNDPRIVLADEPTAALDRDNVQEVALHLGSLARDRGCVVLLVTHDMRIIEHATRVITLMDGRIVSDSRSLAFYDDIRRWTDGVGVDVVLNSLSGEALTKSIELLAPYGRFI
ncbi:MAG: ATP-binding cassette domain-containing protein [candidate division Zixibacteria bacterium]|nr:ATP-binding cassette domain-containing protein [candidate division Zixibacteria bacterium]